MPLINQLIPLGWEAQLHRETYIAVLRGQLRQRGAKQKFAAKVGITPQYLSYLLDPYNHRTPAPVTAERMASVLAMSEHEREHVLEHMVLAAERERTAQRSLKQELSHHMGVDDALCQIRRLDQTAHWGRDPQRVRAERKLTAQVCKAFLSQVDPWQFPLDYAEVALVLNELNTVQGHHSQALYHAKRARFVLSIASTAQAEYEEVRLENLLTNAIRLEAVAYMGLGLSRSAYRLLSEGEDTPAAQHNPSLWLPHLFRDKLNALSHLTNPSLAEAEALALRGARALERAGGSQAPLLALMLERSLSHFYLHMDRVSEAATLLERMITDMGMVTEIGTLHRMLVLKEHASALWRKGDRAAWGAALGDVVELAVEAGLNHQLGLLRGHYRNVPADALAMLAPTVQAQIMPRGQAMLVA